MSIGMKTTGFAELGAGFARAAAALSESAVRADLREAATPILERVVAAIPRDTGLTAADVELRDSQTEAGSVRVEIGASKGKGGRAFILNFIEFGTSRQPARPVLRPAWDSGQPGVMQALVAKWRERVMAALRGGA